jgi:hypothetical protein
LLAIRSKKKHTSFSFDLPFKATCSKMFLFCWQTEKDYTPCQN